MKGKAQPSVGAVSDYKPTTERCGKIIRSSDVYVVSKGYDKNVNSV